MNMFPLISVNTASVPFPEKSIRPLPGERELLVKMFFVIKIDKRDFSYELPFLIRSTGRELSINVLLLKEMLPRLKLPISISNPRDLEILHSLRAAFHLRVFHTHVHARKNLNPSTVHIFKKYVHR